MESQPAPKPPAKTQVMFRLGPVGLAWLDDLAKRNGMTRSEVVRAGLMQLRKQEWKP